MTTILNKEKILEQARVFIEEGKYDKAIREYEKILVADPADMRVKLRVAELHTKRKQITEAIRLYREVADAYSADGFFLKAVTVHKNILRLNPSLSEINEQLAILYEKMGLVADAVRQYDILALALDLKGNAARAMEVRAKVVNLNPKDGAARIKLAELYQREGKEDEALNQYEEYARQLEETGGSKTKLAEIFEKILAHRPDREEMLKKLIRIYDEIGDHKKALKWLEAGKEIVDEDAGLLKLMAGIYTVQHQNDTARQVHMKLADLHEAEGDADAAIDAYCEILALMPDEEERLARKIEELKPGALPKVLKRAEEKRKQAEEDSARRQKTEDAAKHASRAARRERAEEETWPPEQAAPKPAAGASAAAKPQKTPDAASLKQDADNAYRLGMMYHQTGLGDEAAAEFEKALGLYGEISKEGSADSDVAARIEEIRKLLKNVTK